MKKYTSPFLFLFFIYTRLFSQTALDPFDKYGPPGEVYTSLKEALKNKDQAYKVKIDYQPIEAKQLSKLGKLTKTEVLQLTDNGITQLPAELKALQHLVYFSCIGNAITTLPPGFGNLAGLVDLQIHSARLDSLPTEIIALRRLKILEIQNNKADTFHFPDNIGQLAGLSNMVLYNTRIDTLPASFKEFKKLKSLTIVMCGLKKVPQVIGSIHTLETLVLDKNQLTEIPRYIYQLKSLKQLSVNGNKLTAISDFICLLKNLEVLDLRNNYLKQYDIEVLKVLLPRCNIMY